MKFDFNYQERFGTYYNEKDQHLCRINLHKLWKFPWSAKSITLTLSKRTSAEAHKIKVIEMLRNDEVKIRVLTKPKNWTLGEIPNFAKAKKNEIFYVTLDYEE